MMKQIVLPIVGVMAFIIVIGLYFQQASKTNTLPPGATPVPTKTVSVNGRIVQVEIADTEEKRKVGLGGRTKLEENTGMLFVFNPQNVTPIFWMKDTLIPLDIIWINDNKIVKIDPNVQPPKSDTPDVQLQKYTPGQPVDYVLEVPAGYAAVHTTMIGDPVDLSKI